MSWQNLNMMDVKVEEEVVPDRIFALEQEVSSLRAQLNQTNPFLSPPLPKTDVKVSLTKPRDIPLLELHHLQGLDAAARLQMFFELVEQCSNDDTTRIQIAKGRVAPELATLIHSNQLNGKVDTWLALKIFFQTEFATDVTIDRAWQELESMCYDWGESPQAFVHQFICQHAVITTKFPHEEFPNRDKMIKRKLWYGLPSQSRQKLEGFLDDNYPLKKFMDRLENERQLLEERHTSQVNMVPLGKDKVGTKSEELKQVDRENTGATRDEVEELRKQIRELKANLSQTRQERGSRRVTSANNKYCAYCQTTTHNLIDCWRKPPPGHCFACRKPGCRRGDRRCPGRSYESPGKSSQNHDRNSSTNV